MADISNITLPNGENYDIKDKYANIAYGNCTTAAATAAKVISIVDNPNWKLQTGSIIIVKFSYTNTAQNPTLNVNSTGAKPVWYNTSLITTSNLAYAAYGNRYISFLYDGTQFIFIGWSVDQNTTYTSLKNPSALTIQGNGTTLTNGTYDGSAAKTVNITPSSIGAAASSHTHNYAGSSSAGGAATSANKWATARNINGLSVDGTANRVNYGTCSTAAATAAKVVACTGFALVTGAEITVKFAVTNTAASPTLNVNSTGAKAIYYRGSAISAGYLAANRTYTFRYNGTQYDLVGDLDTNTVYTHPTTSGNKHIPSGGSSGQILRWSADGTAAWGADNNTDTKVTSAAVNPSSATTYYPTLVTGATTGTVSYNTDLNAGILQGTASDEGYTVLSLGNNTAKGTAGNKKGQINLYSPSTSYSRILQEGITSPVSHVFPTTGGTVLNSGTTSFTPSITSGSKSGVLKINGNSYNIYFTDTKVTQTNTTTSAAYRLLMSGNANDTTQTVTTCKSAKFTANPSTGCLTASMFKGAYSTVYDGTISGSSGTITISTLWNYSLLFLSIYNIDATLAQVDRYPIAVQKLYAGNSEVIYIFTASGALSTSRFLTFKKSSTANSIDITTSGISKIGQITIEAFL